MVPKGGKFVDKTWDSGLVSPAIWDGHRNSPHDPPLNKTTSLRQIYWVTYPTGQNTHFLSTAGWGGRVGRKDGPIMSLVHLPLMCCHERTTNGQELLHHGEPQHR